MVNAAMAYIATMGILFLYIIYKMVLFFVTPQTTYQYVIDKDGNERVIASNDPEYVDEQA